MTSHKFKIGDKVLYNQPNSYIAGRVLTVTHCSHPLDDPTYRDYYTCRHGADNWFVHECTLTMLIEARS